MRRLSYLCGILFGLCLMVVSGVSHIQRRQSPTPYWILHTIHDVNNQNVYFSSVDGEIRRLLFQVSSSEPIEILGWLVDGKVFLYQTDSQPSQLRSYNVISGQSQLLDERQHRASGQWNAFELKDTERDDIWYLVFIVTDQGDALFRYDEDGQRLQQITPHYQVIMGGGMWRHDEWLFYQAAEFGSSFSTLYRQRVDGSQRQALFNFEDFNGGLRQYISNDKDEFSAIVVNNVLGTSYRVNIDGEDAQVSKIPLNGATLLHEFGSEWWVIYEVINQPYQERYYRENINTGERILLIRDPINQRYVTIEGDDLYYIDNGEAYASLMAIDINTLIQREILPSGRFTEIKFGQRFDEPTRIVFEAVENGQQVMYRINLDGSDLRQLMTFKTDLYHYVYRAGDWILVVDHVDQTSRPDKIVYRVNMETSQSYEVDTFPYGSGHIFSHRSPDPKIIIIDSRNDFREITRQYYVNLSDGVSKEVSFGKAPWFGTFAEQHVNHGLMAGVGLLMVGVSGGIGYRWRNA